MDYLYLKPQSSLPEWSLSRPYQAVLVVEHDVTSEWQSKVSKWLVDTGCLYMMAWGTNCSSWDDSVDVANMEAYGFEEIPEPNFVMTTWHDNEPLREVFWYSKYSASHPVVDQLRTVIIHIAVQEKHDGFLAEYERAIA